MILADSEFRRFGVFDRTVQSDALLPEPSELDAAAGVLSLLGQEHCCSSPNCIADVCPLDES